MRQATPEITVVDSRGGPNLVIRILWFVFIGLWASFLLITLAAAVNLTVVGIPLGIWLMNRIPQVVTLKLDRTRYATVSSGGAATVTISNVPQRSFWLRALWYLLVGWWLTTAWLYLAWFLCLTVVGIPLAFPMFSAAGTLLTLKRG